MKWFVIHTIVFCIFIASYYSYIKTVFEYESESLSATNTTDDNARYFHMVVAGPEGSPFEGGMLKLEFLPKDYPMSAPKVTTGCNLRDENDQLQGENNLGNEKNAAENSNRTLLPKFFEDHDAWHLFNEIMFLLMTILLFLLEIFQLCNFGKNYFKQIENLHQLVIIGTAIVAMCLKPYSHEDNKRGQFVRGAIACGYCISCFELIFVVGKYPFRGGDFSIMFARVLRKLGRYVVAMFMIVGGFSVGLNVITFGTDQDFQFENPFKSFVLTLTMAMGEFNADNLYQDYDNKIIRLKDKPNLKVGRTIAMIILVCMILAGTITMINLFVAVIISDKEKMEEDVFKQKLFYMAEGSEQIKKLVLTKKMSDKLKVDEEMTVCVHKICGPMCKANRVSPSIERIVPELMKIAKKNELKKEKAIQEAK